MLVEIFVASFVKVNRLIGFPGAPSDHICPNSLCSAVTAPSKSFQTTDLSVVVSNLMYWCRNIVVLDSLAMATLRLHKVTFLFS